MPWACKTHNPHLLAVLLLLARLLQRAAGVEVLQLLR